MANLGDYKLVYPVKNDPVKAKLFDQFMDQSKIIWAEVTGGARAKEQAILQVQKANKDLIGVSNRSKTDPMNMKLKA